MTTITILGKNAYITPDPAPPRPKRELKSHHKRLDHVSEIVWGLAELDTLAEREAFLTFAHTNDPWQASEWDEEYAEIPVKVTQAVGDISAHLGYLIERGEWSAIKDIGMGIDPKVMALIREVVPGCLTGNWQWLAREVVAF